MATWVSSNQAVERAGGKSQGETRYTIRSKSRFMSVASGREIIRSCAIYPEAWIKFNGRKRAPFGRGDMDQIPGSWKR
jgi:hypothetical protein